MEPPVAEDVEASTATWLRVVDVVKEAVGGVPVAPRLSTEVLAETLPLLSAARTKKRLLPPLGTVTDLLVVVAMTRSSRSNW